MASPPVQSIVEQVKSLPLEQQLEVAEAVDRLTWARRWRAICERIESAASGHRMMSDEQIAQAVDSVRQEAPRSERSSIRPS